MTLTPAEIVVLCEALRLWRYVDNTGHCRNVSEVRAYDALGLARKLGIEKEYLAGVFNGPVACVTVTVTDLDAKLPRPGRRKKGGLIPVGPLTPPPPG